MSKQSASPQKEKQKTSGARATKAPSAFENYRANHKKVAKSSLRGLLHRPFATFFTCLVIGVAIVLPALLVVVLSNLQSIEQEWDGSAQITLLLKPSVSAEEGAALAGNIATRASIKSSHFIDKETALESFKQRVNFADAVDYLDENPLPHVVIVQPKLSLSSSIDYVEELKQSLVQIPGVEDAILDVLWIKRLQSISSLLERAVSVIGIMLALVVVLVLGNTIRLAIENRKEEIIVMKLVGGTDAFVRRPFLYMGLYYGLGASFVAWLLMLATVAILNEPVIALAESYQSQFSLSVMSFESTLFLFFLGTSLGWFSAWFAVHRHLGDIEPS